MRCQESKRERENRSFWLQQIKYTLLLSAYTQTRTPFPSVCVRVWQTKIKTVETTHFACCCYTYNAISGAALTAAWPSSFWRCTRTTYDFAAQHIKLETLSFIIMTFYEYGILSFHFTRHTASLWHQHGLIQAAMVACWLNHGVYVRFSRNPKFRFRLFVFIFLCLFSYSYACSFFFCSRCCFVCAKCGF